MAEVRAIFFREFKAKETLVLAHSGDQTQHLLWRLQNGELPAILQPTTFVLLIGVNNLGVGFSPKATAKGVAAVYAYLQMERPSARVVVMSILPRGTGEYYHLNHTSMGAVGITNTLIKAKIEAAHDDKLVFVDCVKPFLVKGSNSKGKEPLVNGSLYIGNREIWGGDHSHYLDLVHPNAQGHVIMAQCIRPSLAAV
jgi:lysophospholipase L1-like esterase